MKEVLDTFRVAAELGSDSLGAYVISMASNVCQTINNFYDFGAEFISKHPEITTCVTMKSTANMILCLLCYRQVMYWLLSFYRKMPDLLTVGSRADHALVERELNY